MAKTLTLLLAMLAVPWFAACTTTPTEPTAGPETPIEEGEVAATSAITVAASPTVVERQEPPPTPTIDPAEQPLAPVSVQGLSGIVVPAAAVLQGELEAATAEEAGRADYIMEGVDEDDLTAWFEEQWLQAGWQLAEERDGALVFVHGKDLSAQFSEEGLKRSATVFFGTLEDIPEGSLSFTIVAEAPLAGASD